MALVAAEGDHVAHVRYSRVPGVCGMPVKRANGANSMRPISVPGMGSGKR